MRGSDSGWKIVNNVLAVKYIYTCTFSITRPWLGIAAQHLFHFSSARPITLQMISGDNCSLLVFLSPKWNGWKWPRPGALSISPQSATAYNSFLSALMVISSIVGNSRLYYYLSAFLFKVRSRRPRNRCFFLRISTICDYFYVFVCLRWFAEEVGLNARV